MNLKNKLRQLSEFSQPDSSWVSRNRAHLLARVKTVTSDVTSEAGGVIAGVRGISSLFSFYPRLTAVSFSVILIFISSAGLAAAAKNSLPGSRLYPVKLALERTGLKFMPEKQARTRIQIELVGERLREAQKVAQKTPESVNQALTGFQNSLNDISKTLNPKQMAKTTPKEAGEISQHLIKKTREYKTQLKAAADTLSEPIKEKTAEINKSLDTSKMRAMELMAASAQLGGIDEEIVAEEIQAAMEETETEILAAEQKLTDLTIKKSKGTGLAVELAPVLSEEELEVLEEEDSEEAGEELLPAETDKAKEALNQAKELLEANDLLGAVSKVKEGMELMSQLSAE